ncbi:FAD/NAD(P)-binding domain-containing protein [Tothia fuscella]|uniref:FAD/NAD(P)-binding domain-containing protein n=1 Tax=Tothia fuscella TaxID=1048955 RepID=A0A9P4U3J9_9PEZI|nr:FAD/NAD(P)-binding domain-containing protein [Tothia fuscella]
MAPETKVFDAIVIGSGQSGTPLATALVKSGRKTALVEKSHIGGCCINEGCTPTKTLIASGRAAYMARRGPGYGIPSHVDGAADMIKVRQRKRDIVSNWREGGEKRLKNAGVTVFMGDAKFVGEKEITVESDVGQEEVLKANLIFINVGERPAAPPLDGLEGVIATLPEKVLDSTSIQELGEVPESLIVLGGGYVGLEFAQLFQRLGSKVHVIQRAKQLLPREDPDLAESMKDILMEDGLKVHCSTEAKHITVDPLAQQPITLTTHSKLDDSTSTVTGTHILLATGRRPNTDTLNLAASGVQTDSTGYIPTNEYLETSVPGIYALGDCKGPPAFTHVSYDDFRVIRDNLDLLPYPSASSFGKPIKPHSINTRKSAIPYVCYTDPQLGHVGLHLHDIPTSERKNIQVAKMPMSYVARALETDESRGMMKAVVNGETGDILGFSCIGIEGGEIMAVVQTAMMGGLKWWDLREAIWAHPSLAESLNNIWGYLEDA